MNNINKYLGIFAFFLLANLCYAQISPSSAEGYIGEKITLSYSLIPPSVQDSCDIAFDIFIEKPNIFYPDSAFIDSASRALSLVRLSDSLYKASITISDYSPSDSLRIFVKGELLATNDSICKVFIKNLTINGQIFGDSFAVAKLKSRWQNQYYYRQLLFEDCYPNPTSNGVNTIWNYYADLSQDITIIICDMKGAIIKKEKITTPSAGKFEYRFTPDENLPCGAYLLKVISDFGSACKPFRVAR